MIHDKGEKETDINESDYTLKKITRVHKREILNEFEKMQAGLSFEASCVNCKGGSVFVDEQLQKATVLGKKHLPIKGLIKDGHVEKKYLKDWKFYINEDYVIGVHSGIEHFYKIDKGLLEKSPTSIDALRRHGFETYRDFYAKSVERNRFKTGKRLFDDKGKSFVITHNLKGNTIKEWEKQFKGNELYRQYKRKDNTRLFHEILSWHKDDSENITLAKLEEMTREYIRQRNPNGMYVAVPHYDKDHFHVHICASGVEYKTGKSLRLAKTELQKLKAGIQKFQMDRFPELSKSIVDYQKKGKSFSSDKEYQFKLRTGRQTDKEKILAILEGCFKKSVSKNTFFELLKQRGLKTYDRSGRTTGILYNNQKFRLGRLGFSDDRFTTLEQSDNRGKELRNMRGESRQRTINRDK